MTSSNFTITIQCKHLMPCGWCELKNEICSDYLPRYPYTYDPNMVCVYAAPSGAPIVTCERSEECPKQENTTP